MFLRKPGFTLVARKRLFPSVNPLHMKKKQTHLSCLSHTTAISQVISVPAVHLECRILGKLGLTLRALVRLQACVSPLMQRQGVFRGEGLSTVGADIS